MTLPWRGKIGYGVGHVLNDLCAACWFTYLLVFIESQGLTEVEAGLVMLVGQLVDGGATIAAGFLSDATRRGCFPSLGIGRRKSWHLAGSFLVAASFAASIGFTPSWARKSHTTLSAYYTGTLAAFQVGWATVQVNHMALAPELDPSPAVRTQLNSIRFGAANLSNVVVFLSFFAFTASAYGLNVRLSDMEPAQVQLVFRNITLVILGVGSICLLCFYIFTGDAAAKPARPRGKSSDADSLITDFSLNAPGDTDTPASTPARAATRGRSWRRWLLVPRFYLVACIYMLTRLGANLTMAYLPFFLGQTLEMPAMALATVPLTVFLCGAASTLGQRRLYKGLGRAGAFVLGATLGLGGCFVWMFAEARTANIVYVGAALQGLGSATMMVTAISLEADLVGNDFRSTAFVFGTISFCDKVSSGLAVMVIQHLRQTKDDEPAGKGVESRQVLAYGVGGTIILAVMLALLARRGAQQRDEMTEDFRECKLLIQPGTKEGKDIEEQ